MTTETLLLTLIAIMTSVIAVTVVIGAVVLAKAAREVADLKRRVDGVMNTVQQDVRPTLREFRDTARSLSDLSAAGKRVAEEIALGYTIRRAPHPSPAQAGGDTPLLSGGLDLIVRALNLWRAARKEKSGRAE